MTTTSSHLPDRSAPGVDRHVHLEGGLSPNWIRAQAAFAGCEIPCGLEALWKGQSVDFQDFIQAFFFSCRFIQGREAVCEAIRSVIARLPTSAPSRGLDLWVSPHFLVRHLGLLSLDELWIGMDAGIREARQQGAQVAVIVDAVNHLGPTHGHEVLDLILPERPDWIVGFSTGGMERVPFREWAPVFERARKAGLRIAAHAGENGSAEQVREAIRHGSVERIVHGVRAIQAPGTLELLAERRIPVDVCITSNRALVTDLGEHPLPRMLRAGVRCALGTDDPGLIPCDLESEWHQAKQLGLSDEEMEALRRHGQEDAWCLNPSPK